MAKTTRKNTEKSALTQLTQGDISCESPLFLSRREGSNDGETLLFAEEDPNEFCFVIIADKETNDDGYDTDVKHLLSCPNNLKTKQKYIDNEKSFKAFGNKQGINNNFSKSKKV
eukprot:1728278-Ditylum_brightwellii.AAC.1